MQSHSLYHCVCKPYTPKLQRRDPQRVQHTGDAEPAAEATARWGSPAATHAPLLSLRPVSRQLQPPATSHRGAGPGHGPECCPRRLASSHPQTLAPLDTRIHWTVTSLINSKVLSNCCLGAGCVSNQRPSLARRGGTRLQSSYSGGRVSKTV